MLDILIDCLLQLGCGGLPHLLRHHLACPSHMLHIGGHGRFQFAPVTPSSFGMNEFVYHTTGANEAESRDASLIEKRLGQTRCTQ